MASQWRSPEHMAKNTRTYSDECFALRFLLGGVATGNISLMASGAMTDFEILNCPNKHVKYPNNFFSIYSKIEGEPPVARLLEAFSKGIEDTACGIVGAEMPGLPRYDSSTFSSQYPFGNIEFVKKSDPIKVSLEAFTPFVPLNASDSGLPGFCARYTVTNTADKPADVSICGTMYNIVGFRDYAHNLGLRQDGNAYNHFREQNGLTGVMMSADDLDAGNINFGTMCIATESGEGVSVKREWVEGGWFDDAEEFWEDFMTDGVLRGDVSDETVGSRISPAATRKIGSVASKKTLAPGERADFKFYYFWHFPNRYGWWPDTHKRRDEFVDYTRIFRNYYATQWADAWAAMEYFHTNYERLYRISRDFADALYSSTLDADLVESLVVGLCVLRSPTIFRLESGEFYGWEGCAEQEGSCAGTCTHVWNYAQTAAFLFPEMERSMRRTEFLEEVDEVGEMAFRAKRRLDGKPWQMLPAADGQWGSIVRVYREWKLSGDDEFLRLVWDKLALCVEHSIVAWDQDGDGVMDAVQHNTYDIEFHGINSLASSIMYAALLAAAAMAEHLGDERGATWREIAQRGAKRMDALLWNGEYYKQLLEPGDLDKYKYQFGDGCLSDQLLGQTFAHLYGLGYVLPKEHVRSAMRAIYQHNFKPSLDGHCSAQRGYVRQDESGLLLCSWPKGGRPLHPFVYSDEVWTGIEYQVATSLIYEDMIDEAMDIVRAIRVRHNGYRRSPQNEIECGNHYARSMAGWGLLIALSGYEFDIPNDKIRFNPKIHQDDFRCFYSNGKSWGMLLQKDGKQEIIDLSC